MITSFDAEKAFDEIQYPFRKKTLHKLGTEGNFLHQTRGTYKTHS